MSKSGLIATSLLIILALTVTSGCRSNDLIPNSPSGRISMGSIQLQMPASESQVNTLGLASNQGEDAFTIDQLKCNILILEFFDMYCNVCQASAANLNTLHGKLLMPPFDRSVCMLGIGRGNTQFEVDTFQRNLKVTFPLIPDPASEFAQAIPIDRTPHVLVLQRKEAGFRVVKENTGYFSKDLVEEYTNLILSTLHK